MKDCRRSEKSKVKAPMEQPNNNDNVDYKNYTLCIANDTS